MDGRNIHKLVTWEWLIEVRHCEKPKINQICKFIVERKYASIVQKQRWQNWKKQKEKEEGEKEIGKNEYFMFLRSNDNESETNQ